MDGLAHPQISFFFLGGGGFQPPLSQATKPASAAEESLFRRIAEHSPQGALGFSYDALSRRTQLTRPNNIATNYAYDPLSRLLSVLHQLSGSTIDGATYTVDNAGNRIAKTDKLANVTSNYAYDPIYQLTGVTQGGPTTENYTYDAVGNRLTSGAAATPTTPPTR